MSHPDSSVPPPPDSEQGKPSSTIPNSFVEFENFGQLLTNLESSERAYDANLRSAERQESKHGSIVGFHARLQATALLFQPDPARMPGIDRIEALVNEATGTKLTAKSVRKLRGVLCRILTCGTDYVNDLSMIRAAELLETEGRRPTTARLRSESEATNLYVISTLIGKAEVQAVFDPYLDNQALQTLTDIISLGDGSLSLSIRLLTSSKAQQRQRGVPRLTKSFADRWLQEVGATLGELRLMGTSGEHRRFLLLSGDKSLILGPSLNSLDKNEAASIEPNTADSKFFEESWLQSTQLI